jgi:hypothetical protein
MEGFSRLLNYLGNVKARIKSKIVPISFEKFLRLPARCERVRGNHEGIFAMRSLAARAPVSCNWTKPHALRPIE